MMVFSMNPSEIERRSYEIIRGKLKRELFRSEEEYEIAVRVAHSTADPELAGTLKFHPDFVEASKEAIRKKLPVFVDVEMARCGIKNYAGLLGVDVICAINDPDVVSTAKKEGITKSAAAVRKVLRELEVGILVCGNSPTFLATALSLLEEGNVIKPHAIVGVPVGFVSAEEVKKYLAQNSERFPPSVTNLSPKGGTPVAVSITIFLLSLVRKEKGKSAEYGQHNP